MAIIESSKLIHWNYFLSIEEDVDRLARFIEFTTNNFSAYSVEMARILFAAASEVDVVAKLLCSKVVPAQRPGNMEDYKNILNAYFLKIKDLQVFITRYGLTLTPWDEWQRNENPFWWKAYNKVKHERSQHFHEANLKNTLNAVSGLYLFLLYYYEKEMDEGNLKPCPKLFSLSDTLMKHTTITESGLVKYYDIK
jgi:hypothetical protein